uniref:Uncharacterized protein n=1 Tax=Tanacetum cinerariifolium TaxID=118510 RepID=A0A6L2MK89_TANCI|nr:hypothetical protein [Tanacetum cinerariifolium]
MSNVLTIKRRLVFESTLNVKNKANEIQIGGSAPYAISTQTSDLRMRRGGVTMKDACVRNTGGTEAVSCESGSSSSSSNRLKTISGKIVRMRGK